MNFFLFKFQVWFVLECWLLNIDLWMLNLQNLLLLKWFWFGINDFGCLVAYFLYLIFMDSWIFGAYDFFWTLLSIGGWMLRILHNLWCLDFYLVELLLVNEYFLAIYIYIGSWSYWLLDMDISCQICSWFGNLIEFLLLVILPLILQRLLFFCACLDMDLQTWSICGDISYGILLSISIWQNCYWLLIFDFFVFFDKKKNIDVG